MFHDISMTRSALRLLRLGAFATALTVTALSSAAMAAQSALVFHSASGDHRFNVEVVATPETRAKGLMFVQELAPDAGMLFDFQKEQSVSFWMRNTFIPLDMVFVGNDGVVKSIHVNARPHDPTSIPSGSPVRFVLEIAGGRSKEIGLKVGDTMEHELVAPAQ